MLIVAHWERTTCCHKDFNSVHSFNKNLGVNSSCIIDKQAPLWVWTNDLSSSFNSALQLTTL